jgi:hypothetical protein
MMRIHGFQSTLKLPFAISLGIAHAHPIAERRAGRFHNDEGSETDRSGDCNTLQVACTSAQCNKYGDCLTEEQLSEPNACCSTLGGDLTTFVGL